MLKANQVVCLKKDLKFVRNTSVFSFKLTSAILAPDVELQSTEDALEALGLTVITSFLQ